MWFLIKEQSVKIKEALESDPHFRFWRLQSCLWRLSVVDCMFWRRPEGASWYDWVLLRSHLEEGADSEEELWVTESESDTDTEESDIGDGQDD